MNYKFNLSKAAFKKRAVGKVVMVKCGDVYVRVTLKALFKGANVISDFTCETRDHSPEYLLVNSINN